MMFEFLENWKEPEFVSSLGGTTNSPKSGRRSEV
jgi:hypothetical protein